MIFLRRISI